MTLLGWPATRKMKATLGNWLKDIFKEVLQELVMGLHTD